MKTRNFYRIKIFSTYFSLLFLILATCVSRASEKQGDRKYIDAGISAGHVSSSLGALVRRSQAIVMGEVTEILGPTDGISFTSQEFASQEEGTLATIQLKRILLGDQFDKGDYIDIVFSPENQVPYKKQNCLFFISRNRSFKESRKWGPVPLGKDAYELPEWLVLDGSRAVVQGDTQRLRFFERITKEYLRLIRSAELDLEDYTLLLNRLAESEYRRVRTDVVYDIIRLLDFFPEWFSVARELEEEGRLHGRMAEYVRTFDRNMAREEQICSREAFKNTLQKAAFHEEIASGNKQEISEAFQRLDDFSKRELIAHQALWAPKIRKLLDHDDFDVRVGAAGILALLKDKAAIPILIEALRDEHWSNLGIIVSLQRATGKELPFDSTAPKDVRDKQIRAWEEWWAKEKQKP
ncbi:MAG: hypothetical protein R6V56_00655 [Lentisphaeria bacterium]